MEEREESKGGGVCSIEKRRTDRGEKAERKTRMEKRRKRARQLSRQKDRVRNLRVMERRWIPECEQQTKDKVTHKTRFTLQAFRVYF